jgi:hypothetical protein
MHMQVIRLVSPPEGTIPAYGTSPLTLQFAPLEARYYSVTLPVLLGDGSQELITLQVGFFGAGMSGWVANVIEML